MWASCTDALIPGPLPRPALQNTKRQSSAAVCFCKVYDTRIFIGAAMYDLQQFSCADFTVIARHSFGQPGNYQSGIIDAITN